MSAGIARSRPQGSRSYGEWGRVTAWIFGCGGIGGKRTIEPSAVEHRGSRETPENGRVGDESMLLPYPTPQINEVQCCSRALTAAAPRSSGAVRVVGSRSRRWLYGV